MVATLVSRAGQYASPPVQASARLAEFTLTFSPTPRQLELEHANPLCALAAALPACAGACGQGCGMRAAPPAGQIHTCPLGMIMVQHPIEQAAAAKRWIGRRFPSARALHAALDRLVEWGYEEETLLEHLPPNPVMDPGELRETPSLQPLETAPHRAEPSATNRLTNILEYLEQVDRLLQGVPRVEAVCERFLTAAAAVLPFEEMTVYLADERAHALVIAAALDDPASQRSRPQARPCQLEPGSLGAEAFAGCRVLLERQGRIEMPRGELDGPLRLAIPFPPVGSKPRGVWLARLIEDHPTLSNETLRLMSLLGGLLASRLLHSELLSAAENSEPRDREFAAAGWNLAATRELVRIEAARAARHDQVFTFVRLRMGGGNPHLRLPLQEFTHELKAKLRPYDRLELRLEPQVGWDVVLPQTSPEAAYVTGVRLLMLLEDLIDERGGVEELGLVPAAGLATFGVDTADVDQLLEFAEQASMQALECGDQPRLLHYRCRTTAAVGA